ncbi:NAD(P)H-dependent flavin oxidoreductase [Canibacter zhoujuaniae]|uniref:NAD(P)H-dependent flavin oxidoreductase n=1 Tax=Canibacter zhoujuaniae TaxID=2708343 RepID=UPI00141E7229|nr:nitronate monooxygenase [Canibacter zhoujuaniae]
MFSFSSLELPIVGAPMAGGVSTPELAAAVSAAGGLGFVAGGYLSAESLAEQIQKTRALTDLPFGVNLFMPVTDEQLPSDADKQLTEFATALETVGQQLEAQLGEAKASVESEARVFDELIQVCVSQAVAVVTFTFGCPATELVRRLKDSGSLVGVTVTKPEDAVVAAQAGADFLCVQGPAAGGHQSTFSVSDELNQLPLLQLVAKIRSVCSLPLIAAGGIRTAAQVRELLDAGAVAVEIGTPLLLADEAGTSATQREVLQSLERETVLTRAFTGRFARAIKNSWAERYHETAPAIYPGVHEITAPLRRAAASTGEHEWTHIWAGEPYTGLAAGPAAKILRQIAPTTNSETD